MLYLNLASGTDLRQPPWMNLDIVPKWPGAERGCDIIWDARKDPLPFADNSADEVYCGYLFLHLAPHHHARVLADIYRVMKVDAPMLVREVEMDAVMRKWVFDPTDKQAYELIWGEQGDVHGTNLADFDKHCHGFTEKTLKAFLLSAGFDYKERGFITGAEDVWYDLIVRVLKK